MAISLFIINGMNNIRVFFLFDVAMQQTLCVEMHYTWRKRALGSRKYIWYWNVYYYWTCRKCSIDGRIILNKNIYIIHTLNIKFAIPSWYVIHTLSNRLQLTEKRILKIIVTYVWHYFICGISRQTFYAFKPIYN